MYIYHDANGKINRADGVIHMMLLWCAEKYNFTYAARTFLLVLSKLLTLTNYEIASFHYVEPPDGLFGALINGSWVGMVGMTVNRVRSSLNNNTKKHLTTLQHFCFVAGS